MCACKCMCGNLCVYQCVGSVNVRERAYVDLHPVHLSVGVCVSGV